MPKPACLDRMVGVLLVPLGGIVLLVGLLTPDPLVRAGYIALAMVVGVLAAGAWSGSRGTALLGMAVFAVWFAVMAVSLAKCLAAGETIYWKEVVDFAAATALLGILEGYFVWRAVGRRR
jgi:hypothetical protein